MRCSTICKLTLLSLTLILVSGSAVRAQDSKNILERKTAIYVSGELLDPFYDFYESLKLATRLHTGVEYKLGDQLALGGKLMFSKFKSYPYSAWAGQDPYTIDYQTSDTFPLKRMGYTKGKAFELSIKKFRNKKNGYFPAGLYYEFGLGFHNTKFTGYHFTQSKYNPQLGSYVQSEVNEPERGITTMSVSFRMGKQWVMDNFLFFGYGLTLRGHLPLSSLEDVPGEEVGAGLQTLYAQEILGADWFTTYITIGYLL